MASLKIDSFLLSLVFLMPSFFQLSLNQPLCHKFESLALKQFINNFAVEKHASSLDPFSYPKTELWESQGVDCCLWEGIWCDQLTGHVIGVDLSSSCLFGSINSSSSLFRLNHLQYLNLAFNDFNYSEIPYALGNLSKLTYLNLSSSFFYGQVPFEMSKLSELAVLDLSWNQGFLELKRPDLSRLVQNLTKLEGLYLSSININSPIPCGLANLSSLASLHLSECGLSGKFPSAIFQLSKLEYLHVDGNWGLSGSFPELHFRSPLKALFVNNTGFSGEFPASFGLLSSLEYLEARSCNFSGFLSSSLSNLTMLYHFSLKNNSFQGSTAPFFSNLTHLGYVDLCFNQFTFTEIPSLVSSTHLNVLALSYNQITGSFPSWLVNLTRLTKLDLSNNLLEGYLPSSIFRLKNLEILDISKNKFFGTFAFDSFLRLKNLNYLYLSDNSFSLLTKNITTSTKFSGLGLGSCNLKEVPDFLRNQDQLTILDLSFNDIHGLIPKWLLKVSASLMMFYLHNNSITGFEESYDAIPPSLLVLNLDFNSLTGSLPIPPYSIRLYSAKGNKFSGEIPPAFCNISSLQLLDLSHNNLGGIIPQCLSSKSKSLMILNLEDNNFHGLVPASWAAGHQIREIKLGLNSLHGKLPRSLANCKRLEYLDLSNNRIRDTFPSWLGVLPQLKIIILRFNGFYGAIDGPESDNLFPLLRIIDLSHNDFVGPLPMKYFSRWKAMSSPGGENATYLHVVFNLELSKDFSGPYPLSYSMTITNKGEKMEYAKILEIFTAIDLSCNRFKGEIPEAVGNLRGLQLLNISNNMLVGPISPALGYLSNLEALDLSHNKLRGRIPAQLTQLNFLAVLNVSRNLLTGPIPQDKQFGTFDNSSFNGNPELCGIPLSKKCGYSHSKVLPPFSTSEEKEDSFFLGGFGWKVLLFGCGCGFLGGVVIGSRIFTRKQDWFLKTFRVRHGRRRSGAGRSKEMKSAAGVSTSWYEASSSHALQSEMRQHSLFGKS